MVNARILLEVRHRQRFGEPPDLLAARQGQIEFLGRRSIRPLSGRNKLEVWLICSRCLLTPEDFASHELMIC